MNQQQIHRLIQKANALAVVTKDPQPKQVIAVSGKLRVSTLKHQIKR